MIGDGLMTNRSAHDDEGMMTDELRIAYGVNRVVDDMMRLGAISAQKAADVVFRVMGNWDG